MGLVFNVVSGRGGQLYRQKTVRGNPIAVNDVYSMEHDVECNVERLNYVSYPYTDTTKTEYGVTYTDNGDGSISISGTATYASYFYIFKHKKLNRKKYTFGGLADAVNMKNGVEVFAEDGTRLYTFDNTSPVTVDLNEYPENCTVSFYMKRNKNVETSGIIWPVCCAGDVLLPYTPPVPDLSATTVKQYRENILRPVSFAYNGWRWFGVQSDINAQKTPFHKGTTYTLTIDRNFTKFCMLSTQLNFGSKVQEILTPTDDNKVTFVCEVDTGEYYLATHSEDSIDRFELSVGEKTSGVIEEYAEPIIFTPAADGTVSGMRSISPAMTILSLDGVTIEATYNADRFASMGNDISALNGNVNTLTNAIISTGGNI